MKRMVMMMFAALPAVCAAPAFAQASGAGEIQEKNIPIKVTEVAPGLFFQYHHQESNNAWLVTDDGVLVVDTRQHPRRAEELLAAIRKTTDKPVRWVVNTHAHGDHYFGNSVFKREGAMIVAHRDTAGMMQSHYGLEMKRRQGYFKQRQFDPQEVKLVLPDVTFDSTLTLTVGGRTVELLYLGAGQNPGDTFVRFPKERVLFAGGPFSKNSWPNPSFTPSMTDWLIAATVDTFGHRPWPVLVLVSTPMMKGRPGDRVPPLLTVMVPSTVAATSSVVLYSSGKLYLSKRFWYIFFEDSMKAVLVTMENSALPSPELEPNKRFLPLSAPFCLKKSMGLCVTV